MSASFLFWSHILYLVGFQVQRQTFVASFHVFLHVHLLTTALKRALQRANKILHVSLHWCYHGNTVLHNVGAGAARRCEGFFLWVARPMSVCSKQTSWSAMPHPNGDFLTERRSDVTAAGRGTLSDQVWAWIMGKSCCFFCEEPQN